MTKNKIQRKPSMKHKKRECEICGKPENYTLGLIYYEKHDILLCVDCYKEFVIKNPDEKEDRSTTMPVKKKKQPNTEKTSKTETKQAPQDKSKKVSLDRYCSFCGKMSSPTRRIIAGPNDTFICFECIEVCTKIIGEEDGDVKTSFVLDKIGSQINLPPYQRTRQNYEVLYLAPKNPLFDKLYTSYILPLAEKQKIKVKHFSDVLLSKKPFDKELLDIYNASLIITDVHGKDPDVLYLLGMIHLIGKPLVILYQKTHDIPLGLNNERCLEYKNNDKSLSEISDNIQPIFQAIKKIKRLTNKFSKRPKRQ